MPPEQTTLRTVRLPPRFFFDHQERGLPTPRVNSHRANAVIISLDDPSLSDLEADAEHYATGISTRDFPELFGLVMSARATVRALRAAKRA